MLGLTLEGGGAKGAYQIGAWKAFREMGITFDGITGSSAGALNGAFMVQEDFDVVWDLWYHMTPQQVMDVDAHVYDLLTERKLDQQTLMVFIEEVRKTIQNSGIDTTPLFDRMHLLLKEERIRRSPVDFGFVTVALSDRRPLELFKEEVPRGKLVDYLMASSYLPIFRDRTIDGKRFLDGAFYNNLPANMLVRKGYREIYAVRLMSAGRIIKVSPKEAQVHYILPKRELGHVLDFNQQRSRRNLQLGYLDTLRYLKGWHGERYYFSDFPSEAQSIELILGWNDEAKAEICQLLELKQSKALTRLFLEDALPILFEMADLEASMGYRALLVRILEAIAEIYEVDDLKVYSFQELLRTIESVPSPLKIKTRSEPSSFMALTESLFRPGREKKKASLLKLLVSHTEWFSLSHES